MASKSWQWANEKDRMYQMAESGGIELVKIIEWDLNDLIHRLFLLKYKVGEEQGEPVSEHARVHGEKIEHEDNS